MLSFLKITIKKLCTLLPINSYYIFKNEVTLNCSAKYISLISLFLKNHTYLQLKVLTSISAVDYIERFNRFELIYEFLSIQYNFRLRVKVYSNEMNTLFPSITSIFNCASWWEREIWDLFGLYFSDNNDLRRILTDYGFEGFPLRKDFPLTGYQEITYNYIKRACFYESIELIQQNKIINSFNVW